MFVSRICFVTFLMLTCSASTLRAQEQGIIRGRVIDKVTQQPMVGANITVVGSTTGASTDSVGRFTIADLDENVYKLRTSFVGYLAAITTDVRIVRNKSAYVTIELTEDPVKGEEITVSADQFQIDKQAPVSSYSYSREEINRSPGAAGDIFRAIETLPGVSSSGGEFSSFSVRGGSPRDNIVLVDNIPVDRLTHFDGGSEDQEAQGGRFSVFAPKVIEEAKFQGGGFSARFGGKNASLVELRLREGNRDDMTLNGSYDILGWEVNYDGPSYFDSNTSLLVAARHQDFTSILGLTGQEDLGSPSFTDVIVKTSTLLNSRHRLSFLGIVAPEQFDRTLDNVYHSENAAQNELQRLREDKYVAGLNWIFLTGSTSSLHTTVYYKARDAHYVFGRAFTAGTGGTPLPQAAAPTRDVFSFSGKEQDLGVKSTFTAVLDETSILTGGFELFHAGADYTRTQNGLDTLYTYDRYDYRADPSMHFIIRRPEDVNTRFDQGRSAGAAFVDNSFTLGSLVITPGIRYEQAGFNKTTHVSPRLSATYAFDAATRLNLAAGLYYQPPDLTLASDDARNSLLEDERAVHAIVGIARYFGSDLKFAIEGYYKSLDNLVTWPDRTSPQRANRGEGWSYGVDVGIVRRFVDHWYGQVNFSYAQSRRNDNDGGGWYNSDFNQPHIFNILVGYEISSEWSLSAKWKYATGRPADMSLVHVNVHNDPAFVRYSKEIVGNNARRLDDFHSFNIRVDYRTQLGRVALVSFLDVLNLYNRLNVNEERFLELTGETVRKGFRIIPTIGVKLEL